MALKRRQTTYGLVAQDFIDEPLRDLCDNNAGIQTGPFGSQLHQEDYVASGTPIITVEHLGENRILHSALPRVSDSDRDRLSRYVLRVGDIVFSRVGSVDRRSLVRAAEDGWLFSGRCLRVRPDPRKIDPTYLAYFFGLPAFKEHIRSIAVGATMPSLNTDLLSGVLVPHPEDIQEQRAIGRVLGALDDKIEVNRRMNETLEATARALFKSWFVDFDPVRAKAEERETSLPSQIVDLFPARFVKSELGRLVPEEWPLTKWENLVTLEYGKSLSGYSTDSARIPVGHFPVFGTNGLIGSTSAALCSHPGIIVGRKGAYRGIHYCNTPFFVIDTAFYVSPKVPLELRWAYYELLRHDLDDIDSGSAIPSTSRRDIYNIPVVLPPIELQTAFVRMLEPHWSRQNLDESINRSLFAIRDILLPKLISGEIRVKDAERFVEATAA